jgi:hypothetical protein
MKLFAQELMIDSNRMASGDASGSFFVGRFTSIEPEKLNLQRPDQLLKESRLNFVQKK